MLVCLLDASVDYHISTTVFEHIPKKGVARILKGVKRILKDDGIAIHFIDLSDHFQHQDKSIGFCPVDFFIEECGFSGGGLERLS